MSNKEMPVSFEAKKEAKTKDQLSLEAYEERADEILTSEKRGEVIGEIIEGPKMPLKVLRNKFNRTSKSFVFLVHGTGMNEFSWAPVLKPLEKKGINAITYAWRGHSPSMLFDGKKFAGTGLIDYIDDAKSVLEYYKNELGLDDENIVIVGHSFGTIINSYLAKNKKFKSLLNFCAGYLNEEYFLNAGVDTNKKDEITNALGKLWSFSSEEYIKKTIDESKRNEYFESYRDMGQLTSYLSELFNLEIPDKYSGSLEKLLGPTSRVAVADGLLVPPFLLKKKDIISPTHFFAATNDRMVPVDTIKKIAETWSGSYDELPGPHVGTFSPYLDKYIEQITKYHNL